MVSIPSALCERLQVSWLLYCSVRLTKATCCVSLLYSYMAYGHGQCDQEGGSFRYKITTEMEALDHKFITRRVT